MLVSPSTGKTWITPPWKVVDLVPIPLDLLLTVAVPTHPTVDISIIFNAEEGDGTETIMFHKNKWIRKMPFFDAIISGNFSSTAANLSAAISSTPSSTATLSSVAPSASLTTPESKVPEARVSWTSRDFKELLHFLDYGELNRLPTDETKKNLEEFANYLLLSQRAPEKMTPLRSPALGRVAFQTDLLSISERMCELDIELFKIWRNNKSLDDLLITIDAELAIKVNYVPLKKDNRWLYKDFPTIVDCMVTDEKERKDVKVFKQDPSESIKDDFSPTLLAALTKYHDCLVVAGGAIVGAIGKFASHGDDFDLFVYGINREKANAVTDDIRKMFRGTHDAVETSFRAISFVPNEDPTDQNKAWFSNSTTPRPNDKKVVQVILKLYTDRSEILGSFDMAPCKALAQCTPSGELIVEALPIFVECMRHMTFYSDAWTRWAPTSITRIFKYVAKGFECVIPGLVREAFIVMPKVRKYGGGDYTLRGLLDSECEALRVYAGLQPKSGKKGGFMLRPSWCDNVQIEAATEPALKTSIAAEPVVVKSNDSSEAAMAWISHRLSSLYFGDKATSDVDTDDSSKIPTGEAVKPDDNMRIWLPYDRWQDQIVSDAATEEVYDKAKLIQLEKIQLEDGSYAHLPYVDSDDDIDDDNDEEDEGDNFGGYDDDEFGGFGYNFF